MKYQQEDQKAAIRLKPASEIVVIFEAWNLNADTRHYARTLVHKNIKTHLDIANDVDEQYLVHADSEPSSLGIYFCTREQCYFNKNAPQSLSFLLSFSSAEYLRQHQRRTGHTSPQASEDKLKFMSSDTDFEFDLQDLECTNMPTQNLLTDASDRQSELAHLPSFYSDFEFSLPTELMSRTFTNDTLLKPSAISERSATPLSRGDLDPYSSTTPNLLSQSVPGDIAFSSNNSPLSFRLEAEEYAVLDNVCDFLHLPAQLDSFPQGSDRQYRGLEGGLNNEVGIHSLAHS